MATEIPYQVRRSSSQARQARQIHGGEMTLTKEQQERLQQAYFDSFKSKGLATKAAKKQKKQPESKVRDACKDLLQLWNCFVWVNRTGMYSPRPGQMIPYGYPGSGGLLGCTRKGRFLCVETKYSTGQTEKQKLFQLAVERCGGIYILAYSIDDLIRRKAEICS